MEHQFLDVYSDGTSCLHRVGARAKLAATIVVLLTVVSTPVSAPSLFLWYTLFLLSLTALSGVPFVFFLKRLAAIVPVIAVTGTAVLFMHPPDGRLLLFTALIGKATISFLALCLLTATTRFPDLLRAGQSFGMPRLLSLTAAFMYRYIFIIYDELLRLRRAWKCRYFSQTRPGIWRAFSSLLGTLFLRSYERSERIHLAMCSRGFDGTFRTARADRPATKDILFFLAATTIVLVIRTHGNTHGFTTLVRLP